VFFVGHRGSRFASSALMTSAFTADIGHFIAARGRDLVRFGRGQRKDTEAGYEQQARHVRDAIAIGFYPDAVPGPCAPGAQRADYRARAPACGG
jgi:hypothetical protein